MPYKDPIKQREVSNRWTREQVALRKRDWFAKNGPCYRCGAWEGLETEWIGTGERNHRVWTYSNAKREAILGNYRAVCRSCRDCNYPNTLSRERVADVLQLSSQGFGTRNISFILGISRDVVEKYINRSKLQRPDNCLCGKLFRHEGMCWATLTREHLATGKVSEWREYNKMRMALNRARKAIGEAVNG